MVGKILFFLGFLMVIDQSQAFESSPISQLMEGGVSKKILVLPESETVAQYRISDEKSFEELLTSYSFSYKKVNEFKKEQKAQTLSLFKGPKDFVQSGSGGACHALSSLYTAFAKDTKSFNQMFFGESDTALYIQFPFLPDLAQATSQSDLLYGWSVPDKNDNRVSEASRSFYKVFKVQGNNPSGLFSALNPTTNLLLRALSAYIKDIAGEGWDPQKQGAFTGMTLSVEKRDASYQYDLVLGATRSIQASTFFLQKGECYRGIGRKDVKEKQLPKTRVVLDLQEGKADFYIDGKVEETHLYSQTCFRFLLNAPRTTFGHVVASVDLGQGPILFDPQSGHRGPLWDSLSGLGNMAAVLLSTPGHFDFLKTL